MSDRIREGSLKLTCCLELFTDICQVKKPGMGKKNNVNIKKNYNFWFGASFKKVNGLILS